MILLIVIFSIIGVIANIFFWVWIYRLVFGSKTHSSFTSFGSSFNKGVSNPSNSVNYSDLMNFMHGLQQLEEQIHQQTNINSLDNEFQQFYSLIQKSTKKSSGENVKIDPTTSAQMNNQYFKMMDHMREFDQISQMKSDLFQSDLSSMASSAGIDMSRPMY